jgi:penicillin-binding protein 1C
MTEYGRLTTDDGPRTTDHGLRTTAHGPHATRSRLRRRVVWGLVAVSSAALVWLRCGPLPDDLLTTPVAESTMVVDRNGVPLYESLSGDGTRSVQLTAGTIPDVVSAATVAAEDHRFWSHLGVDPVAIARALKRNLGEGRVAEGGSTITQQVVKLLMLRRAPDRRRGWIAKLHEAVVALRLEHRLGKREILALYLNLASYGNQVNGVERASRTYFGVEARMLTPAQAAFLAGLPQRPTSFNPYRSQALAVSRQRVVLARMAAAGMLSATDLDEANRERLELAPLDRRFLAPHFVEMVLSRAASPRPSRIATTLDVALQEDVAGIIRSQWAALQRHGAANVAVVVLDNVRGEWLAWEGSGDYFDTTHGGSINGPVTPRQPGSALKPFTYALAFEQGFSPASVLPDVPMHFPTAEEGVVYTPQNYDGRYRGPLLARAALAGSENVPAVALASQIGVPGLLRVLHRAGFSTFDRSAAYYGLGVTLGNAEVRLDELVAAYAAFARGGDWVSPTWVADRSTASERRALVSPRTAFWINDILSDADARAYIFGRGSSLELPFPAAVKTGTSQAYHDNWTIGYTPRVTVGVWVGNFDRRPLRNSSGVTGAAPIFQAVMLAASRRLGGGDEPFSTADTSLVTREICALSGQAANAWCPITRRERLTPGDEQVACSWHHRSDDGVVVAWPSEYREWARRNSEGRAVTVRPLLSPISPSAVNNAQLQSRPATAPLELVNPPSGATYLLDPTLRPEFQTLALRVVAGRPVRIDWSVNGTSIGSASSETTLDWPLKVGRHRITARDETGRAVESVVTVR